MPKKYQPSANPFRLPPLIFNETEEMMAILNEIQEMVASPMPKKLQPSANSFPLPTVTIKTEQILLRRCWGNIKPAPTQSLSQQ
jgi:hypothetical protein